MFGCSSDISEVRPHKSLLWVSPCTGAKAAFPELAKWDLGQTEPQLPDIKGCWMSSRSSVHLLFRPGFGSTHHGSPVAGKGVCSHSS